MAERGRAERGVVRAGLRFLARRPRVLLGLAGWSVLEAAQAFALGFALARALDEGFLAGRPGTGLCWLGLAACGVLAGALGTAGVYRSVASLVEPLRDALVRRVVGRGLYEAVNGAAEPGGSGGGTRTPGASAVSRLTHQVEIARDSFAGIVLVSRSFAVSAAGALAGLLTLAPALLPAVLPPLLAGLAVFAAALRPLARRQRDFLVADEELAAELGGTVAALRDVVACGAEEPVRRTALRRIEAERRAADSLARWGTSRALALGVGGRLPVVLLLVLAPWLLRHGVTAGALAGALTYLTQSLLPALHSLMHGLGGAGARLTVVLGRLREGVAGTSYETGPETPYGTGPGPRAEPGPRVEPGSRVEPGPRGELGPEPEPEPEPEHAGPRSCAPPAVELRGVTFAYGPSAEPVLRGLDLTLPAGGHLAVVGPSGAGKSTLALLLAGLLEPSRGAILLGGRPLRAGGGVPGEEAERRVLVPQETYLFSGSVRDNLGCLLPAHRRAPTDAEVAEAADAVGALDLLHRLGGPGGYVDPAALSGGERQLLALARAYLSPAPLAVLDEAASSLDPAAEEAAERAFARRPGALIVIAHRISSALRADRVLVLDGERTRCGTHAELLACSPLYRDLTANWAPRGSRWSGGRRGTGSHPAGSL
ncbi:ABC transporter ATP-binding protein [Streptomyces sp. ODS28]|uniref:ABC transporter ATP-binding protein n=1 Tax=Streptomyces sp. ODS28 TaxID=3136688 RepID=UPI0031EC38C5